MENEIQQLLKSHGEQLDFIAGKVAEHDEQLEWLRENAATKADIRNITCKVADNDEQLQWLKENSATKEDLQLFKESAATKADLNDIAGTLDKLVQLAEKKDQELVIMAHGIKRLDDKVEVIEGDIRKIKPALGLS